MDNYFTFPLIANIGEMAVSFFFVLSGFLITYLLLEEDKKFGKISITRFYMRRILRIWPLYYLIVVLILGVLPIALPLDELFGPDRVSNQMLVYGSLAFILPNLLRVTSTMLVGGNQLWSIGVEEQFYLIWPLLFAFFRKNIMRFLIFFLVFKAGLTVVLWYMESIFPNKIAVSQATFLWELLKIEQMTIGAIASALVFFEREKLLEILYSKAVQWGTLFLIVVFSFMPEQFKFYSYLEAAIYAIFIVNVSTNKRTVVTLGSKLNYLGQISYGIYMYHTVAITLVMSALYYLGISNSLQYNLVMYPVSFALTLILAHFSYQYFEKPILRIKRRFQRVPSTDSDESSQVVIPAVVKVEAKQKS